jgi:hypothetical protein
MHEEQEKTHRFLVHSELRLSGETAIGFARHRAGEGAEASLGKLYLNQCDEILTERRKKAGFTCLNGTG